MKVTEKLTGISNKRLFALVPGDIQFSGSRKVTLRFEDVLEDVLIEIVPELSQSVP